MKSLRFYLLPALVCLLSLYCAQAEVEYSVVSRKEPLEQPELSSDLLLRRRREVTASASPPTPLPTTTADPRMKMKMFKDDHSYYHSTVVIDKEMVENYRRVFGFLPRVYKRHATLSSASRMALQISLKFRFLFYGHDDVQKVTIATGGFLYMSDYLHRYLTFSQYIAPLMADFDTKIGSGDIAYADTGSALFVRWENVHLKNQAGDGNFTFEVILHKNGTIIFVYEQIPLTLTKISSAAHSVKVGVSDAYYIDEPIPNNKYYFTRRIIKYHDTNIRKDLVMSNAVVILHPLPTCVEQKSCSDCSSAKIGFTCNWCESVERCSSGTDRMKQEWEKKKCHKIGKLKDCPHHPLDPGIIFLIFLLCALFVASLVGFIVWLIYAFRNPTTRSGIFLMEHRPSVLAARFTNWRRGGTNQQTSDIYRVDSVA